MLCCVLQLLLCVYTSYGRKVLLTLIARIGINQFSLLCYHYCWSGNNRQLLHCPQSLATKDYDYYVIRRRNTGDSLQGPDNVAYAINEQDN